MGDRPVQVFTPEAGGRASLAVAWGGGAGGATGHGLRPRSDLIGVTARRRWVECLKATCGAAGHPLGDWFGPDNVHPERTFMLCKCAERDESGGT
jgi:hypothetical protein